ncbi:MAG: HAMP domain-containing sensor histidine kinase [Bacteroides sp.]|nr:HAMP domain-containing sensor histidine kinase [Bacteroides sp.]
MKKYSLIVTLHILGIVLLGAGLCLLIQAHLWFSALMSFLILIGIGIHLYRMQMIQMRMMRHLTESLRRGDMMLSFRSPYRNRPMEEMVKELSEAMNDFRTHVLERNEMEAWQKLIRVLTHEIMNSITPIISLSETLSEREVSEKNYPLMQQGMQTIHRRSKGLLEFVENYRKLTRLPAPVRRPTSLRELLSDLRKLFPEPYIHIELPTNDRTFRIDRAQIEQVLINLLKNAQEACHNEQAPSIEVKVEPSPAWQCRISITDNGNGMLPEVQDKIFVPFFTTKPSGSGIGLSLCKQIMNRHGGNITVSSTIGQGSCFILQFGGE